MQIKRMKILCVYPYLGLETIIKKVVDEFEDMDVVYEFGELDSGVDIAKQYTASDIDAIISRGGTASMISQAVRIPTFDIGISTIDLIQTMVLARNTQCSKLALVGFNEVTAEAKFLDRFLEQPFDIYETLKASDYVALMDRLKDDGTELVIGDATAARHARDAGINNIMIASGEESVRKCIASVRYFIELLESNKNLLRLQRNVIKNLDLSFFIVKNEKVIHSQVNSDNRLLISQKVMEQVSLSMCEKFTDRENAVSQFEHGGLMWMLDIVKDHIGESDIALVIWRRLNFLADRENELFEDLSQVNYPFEVGSFDTKENLMFLAIEDGKNFARTNAPILICGEPYTGRSPMARLIYRQSNFGSGALLGLDARNLSEKNLSFIFETTNSRLNSLSLTLVVHSLQYIDRQLAMRFLNYITTSCLCKRSRVIFIFDQGSAVSGSESLNRYILSELGALVISIPTLRQRVGDIKFLATVALGEFCSLYGKNCQGFDDEASDFIVNYQWPGNLHELRGVIRQICASLQKDFISYDDLMYGITKWQSLYAPDRDSDSALLQGTLSEIEGRVIKRVMEAEQGRKLNVAKRLGISRNTLWRKLKELGLEE